MTLKHNTPESKKADVFKRGTEHEAYVGVTRGLAGWFAVLYWWNTGEPAPNGGFWEPWDTGIGRYPDRESAVLEALQIANENNLLCKAK